MIIIAESGSTKCDWIILNSEGSEQLRLKTIGFNPYFHSTEFVKKTLESDARMLNLKSSITSIYFYGAGYSSDTLKAQIEQGLSSFFTEAEVKVDHDLVAAAYSLYQGKPLISCILGTGSNSGYFDGNQVDEEVPALGFILGDEASGCDIGKQFIKDFLYKKLPPDLYEKFLTEFGLGWCEIRPEVYNATHANVYLSSFMPFIVEHRSSEHIQQIVNKSIQAFIEIHIKSYPQYRDVEVGFVGSIAYLFQDNLNSELEKAGCMVGRIIQGPVDHLVDYHLDQMDVLAKLESA